MAGIENLNGGGTPAPEAKETVVETKVTESASGSTPAAEPAAGGAGGTTPAPSGDAPSEGESEGSGNASAAYTANFEFLVDKEKKEIPEWARALCTSPEMEKQVKEVFQKAAGLDVAKPRHESVKTRLAETEQELNGIKSSLEEISGFVKNGDYDSFFEAIGLPQKAVLEYALQLIQRDKWTPEQRQEWQRTRSTQEKARLLERENATLSQSQRQLVVQQRERDVDTVLARPDIATHAAAFDARVGRPGAFREEVWNRGVALSAQLKQDVSPETAVTSFLGLLGITLGSPTPGATGTPGNQVISKPAPVIPNVQGRTASPTRKKPTSIADLKKLAKDMAG